jgi:hypothetical protein
MNHTLDAALRQFLLDITCSMVDGGNRVKMRRAYATRTARTLDR